MRMFAQSTDPFIFYNLPFKKGEKTRDFQHYFHTNKSQEFFINLVNYIKYNDYYQNSEIMAFLYGFISHYVLDSTIHPFIIYKTGVFDKNNEDTFKYQGGHTLMENFLDNYLIKQREHITPYEFKFYDFCFDFTKFSKELVEVINYAFKETFNFDNFGTYYQKALKDMYFYLKYFRYDKYGIKMKIYKGVDKLTRPITFKLQTISYYTPLKDDKNYLNNNHTIWYNPVSKKDKHKESFVELYSISLFKTKNIIRDVNSYLKGNEKINLKKVFDNSSYLTGKNCNNKNIMKYFEY